MNRMTFRLKDALEISDERQAADDAYTIAALRAVIAARERELLELKGPCSNSGCTLHYAHTGPCDVIP